MLLAGLGEALLALVEDLGSHVGELGAQGVAGFLQVFQALLVAFLLLAQFGVQACGLGLQATQFGFAVGTFEVPGVSGITGIVTVDLQQFQLTALGSQLGLLDGVGFAEIADFIAAGVSCACKPARASWAALRRSSSKACSPCRVPWRRCTCMTQPRQGNAPATKPSRMLARSTVMLTPNDPG